MKKLATSLTALIIATGLSLSAQAATKTTTTQKAAPVSTHKTTTTKTTGKNVKKDTKSDKKTTSTAKKKQVATKTTTKGKKTNEVNIDIPAELKIDETNNRTVTPSGNAQPANPAVVVPVTHVMQTGPAMQSTSVQPIDKNTAISSTTTTIPVDVQTVPVVVNP